MSLPRVYDDFRAFYRAGQLSSAGQNVYANPVIDGDFLAYVRAPSYAWMFRSLARLPYERARAIWITLLIIALVLFVCLWPSRRVPVLVSLCLSMPLVMVMVLGQDTPLLLLIVAVSARLWLSGREFAAGLAASLLFLKFTFLLPVGLVFLARSRRGFAGIVLGSIFQLGLSFWVAGPQWPAQYLAILNDAGLDPETRHMPSVRGLTTGLPFQRVIGGVGSLVLYGWTWWVARRAASSLDALAMALPLGIIAAPHCFVYDMVLAIPALASMASLRVWPGPVALLLLSPLPFVFVMGSTRVTAFLGCLGFVLGVVYLSWWPVRPRPST